MATIKGFLKDWQNQYVLPITRGELVLDEDGNIALNSEHFLAKFVNGKDVPGLITAAERQMLSGGGSGGGIQDIYTKLNAINTGIKVNNASTTLNYYDSSNNATPIIFKGVTDHIDITTANNIINFGLAEIHDAEINVNKIVKSIKVDKNGRITEVTGGDLLDAEIPQTLTNKILSGATTDVDVIANNNKAVANKYYVDQKFNEIAGLATGALSFGGAISTANEALTKLNDSKNFNKYYKAIAPFELNSTYLHEETDSTSSGKIKVGDTLIIYPINATTAKFVHVPSGDDITTITVAKEGEVTNVLHQKTGHVTFHFGSIFSVINPENSQIAAIDFPQVSASSDGYLTKQDYVKFSQYGSNLLVEYDQSILAGMDGAYQIGTITIGGDDTVIYGLNNISKLTLTDGATNAYDPILKFEETGLDPVSITYKGSNGIKVRKLTTGNVVEIYAANEVVKQKAPGTTTDVEYLTIQDGYKFGVKIGSGSGNTLVHGLTDYSEFQQVRIGLSLTTVFEGITNSLTDETADFHYGSDDLKTAITVTI